MFCQIYVYDFLSIHLEKYDPTKAHVFPIIRYKITSFWDYDPMQMDFLLTEIWTTQRFQGFQTSTKCM